MLEERLSSLESQIVMLNKTIALLTNALSGKLTGAATPKEETKVKTVPPTTTFQDVQPATVEPVAEKVEAAPVTKKKVAKKKVAKKKTTKKKVAAKKATVKTDELPANADDLAAQDEINKAFVALTQKQRDGKVDVATTQGSAVHLMKVLKVKGKAEITQDNVGALKSGIQHIGELFEEGYSLEEIKAELDFAGNVYAEGGPAALKEHVDNFFAEEDAA